MTDITSDKEKASILVEDLDNLIEASTVYLTLLSEQVFEQAAKVQRLSILVNQNVHSLKAFSTMLEQTSTKSDSSLKTPQKSNTTTPITSTTKSTPKQTPQSFED